MSEEVTKSNGPSDADCRSFVDGCRARYADPTGRLLNILNDVQDRYRYLPEAALARISEVEGIPVSRIKGMARFFNRLSLDPVGRVVIDVCDGTACHALGAEQLLGEFGRFLGIEPGQTTKDGRITLRTVGCVGACGIAPAVVVEGEAFGRVRVTRVKDIAENAVGRAKRDEERERLGE